MPRGLGPVLTVWIAWLLLMGGSNLATPLYPVYADRFHFSSLVLTAVFATYAVVLVPSLVLFGRLSDVLGRRLVILLGLGVAVVGLISGAATAALVELDPDEDRRRAALLAGVAQAGGSALGPVVAGPLAQW